MTKVDMVLEKGIKMDKTKTLFDLLIYVNSKQQFTANDVAQEFNISIRTAHRYLSELNQMGVPLYTETGRNGGYRVLPGRVLPPVIFNENEAFSIFFAFQSLQYYRSLPFEIDIESASRKLFSKLPMDIKKQIDQLHSSLAFWNRKRDIETPFLKELIKYVSQKSIIDISYLSTSGVNERAVAPIGVYAYDGFWYLPAFDYKNDEIRLFRADRISLIKDTGNFHNFEITLSDWLYSYKIVNPIHLYVELTNEGLRQSKSNPFFETDVWQNKNDDGGYIDTTIDYSDIGFIARFFLQLGSHAKIIEPAEMKEYICNEAQKILNLYN